MKNNLMSFNSASAERSQARMKQEGGLMFLIAWLPILGLQLATGFSQGIAFTYQGRLSDNGRLPDAKYDMRFSLWSAPPSSIQLGNSITKSGVEVSAGIFTVTLNSANEFGVNAFVGGDRWLQVEISPANANTYTQLSARQAITSTPYAIRAGDAGTLNGLYPSAFAAASALSGLVSKNGDTMTGALNLPANGLIVGKNQLTVFGGNIGIGTGTPSVPLEVFTTAGTGSGPITRFTSANGYGTTIEFRNSGSTPDAIGGINFVDNAGNIPGSMSYHHTFDDSMHFHVAGDDLVQFIQTGIQVTTHNAGYGATLQLRNLTPSPAALGAINFEDADGTYRGQISYRVGDSMHFTVGTYERMQISSDGTVSVGVLQINGADVAEPFEVSTKNVPKGSVMVIDEENQGQLKLSDHAYDKRVGGILSGANGVHPGIRLKQEGFNDHGEEMALSGRVYALADASSGAIKPGDLLTTSDTPGHCMKATDLARAHGAIIGKAMSELEEGKGMVLVLVSLQ